MTLNPNRAALSDRKLMGNLIGPVFGRHPDHNTTGEATLKQNGPYIGAGGEQKAMFSSTYPFAVRTELVSMLVSYR